MSAVTALTTFTVFSRSQLSLRQNFQQVNAFGFFLCRENARKKDVRTTNIEAAKAVADAIRTSLGPRGMDKMVICSYTVFS